MTRRLTLVEYQTTSKVALTTAERTMLGLIAPSVAITPSQHDGYYDLRPTSWVGAIRVGDLQIDIRPKIGVSRLLFLLSYALDPRIWRDTDFDFHEENSLLEALIPGFVSQVRRALTRGLLHGYRTEEDALPTMRGRLRFDDQIRERFGRLPPVEVRYDEFTPDIEENRLIKAAIARLTRMPIRSRTVLRLLHGVDAMFESVRLVAYDPRQLPEVHYTRLNEHYRPAVELARLILRAASFEHQHGEVRASAFLVNMNDVFEDFVVVALREALNLSKGTFPQGAAGRTLYLDHQRHIRLKPDISWWDGNACHFVGDVKYKRVEVDGVIHPDVYQVLAYTIATGLSEGLLIYAAGEAEPVTHTIVHAGKEIAVTTLDLDRSPDEILRQIAQIANRIRELRQEALNEKSEQWTVATSYSWR